METTFDEEKWPELTLFREACLKEEYAFMHEIASKRHHWYSNENPTDLPMPQLAKIYQAQHYAAKNELDNLRALIVHEPWVINQPWTAQRWLPITQAAFYGNSEVIQLLLDQGADAALTVGDPGEECSVSEMARYGGHEDLAKWLEEISGT
jgi:hypothetical protein